MSTNKTPNLDMHSWQGTDNVLREEFNDNFNKVDSKFSETTLAGGHDHGGAGSGAPIPTAGIAAKAVTTEKIADGAVGNLQLAEFLIDQGVAPEADNKAKPLAIFSWIANRIKAITGKADWKTDPAITLESASTKLTEYETHKTDPAAHGTGYAATTGAANAYVLAIAGITALTAGLRVTAKINIANTGASTINLNALGAKAIVKAGGTALSSGNLKLGGVYTFVYDGTSFQLLGEGGEYGTAQASDVLSGKTIGTDSGLVDGSMTNRGAVVLTPGTTSKTIADGYHNGSGYVTGDADLISANIKAGANIFGVPGNANVVDTSAGDAVAANILSGKKAYVDGALITGTITSKAAATITPGTTAQTIAAGLYLSGIQTIAGDPDLIAANILSGKNIFGVAGAAPDGITLTPGDVVILNVGYVYGTSSTTEYVKRKEYQLGPNVRGAVRIVFDFRDTDNDSKTTYAMIYINGVPRGTERVSSYPASQIKYTEDFTVNAGDLIQVYTKNNGTIYNFQIKATENLFISENQVI